MLPKSFLVHNCIGRKNRENSGALKPSSNQRALITLMRIGNSSSKKLSQKA